jgi:Flp pilus assembly protein TadD
MIALFKKNYQYLIIFLVVCAIYAQNLSFSYVYLDDNLIVFQEFHKIDNLSKIPSTFKGGYIFDTYYRPVIMISFIIDSAIAGQSSTMYHLTNLILHIIVSFLVYSLLKRISGKELLSLILALLFSIHPLNINAVSWIAGRNDLIVALFALLSFLEFIKFCETDRRRFLFLSSFYFLAAMFSKETGIIIPVILFIYYVLFKIQLSNWKLIFKKSKPKSLFVAFVPPVLIYLTFRLLLSPVIIRDEMSMSSFLRNLNIPFEYIAKLFYLFDFSPLSMTNMKLVILGILLSAAILIYVFTNKNVERRISLLGITIFLLFLLPSMFVRMPASDGGFNYIDCRNYLPMFGILLIFMSIIKSFKSYSFWRIRTIRVFASTLFLIFFTYVFVFNLIENQYYKNGEIFWTRVLEIYPGRATYWMGLGYYYFDNKEYIKAAECAEKAISLKPGMKENYFEAALAYEKAGNLDKANFLLEEFMSFQKDDPANLLKLIKINLELGNYEKAGSLKNDFDKINIADLKEKSNLYSSAAYYFGQSKKYDQAIELMSKASRYQPQNPFYINDLGVFYFTIGKIDSAKIYFSEALKLSPENKEFQKNYNLADKKQGHNL